MKIIKGFYTALSAAALLWFSASSRIVNAAPAPFFEPILEKLQYVLPDGMFMRLPSKIEIRWEGNKLLPIYASLDNLDQEENVIKIALANEPFCGARYCIVGYIGSALKNYETEHMRDFLNSDKSTWSEYGIVGTAKITLAKGVVGQYYRVSFPRGNIGSYGVVLWEQDSQVYIVSMYGERQEVLNVAISMANEKPIKPSP